VDLKQIKQIIELMKRSDLSEFAFEEDGLKIKICRGANGLPVVSSAPTTIYTPAPVTAPIPVTPIANTPTPASITVDEVGVTYIKSPMVGTFYRAASPESKPFAEIGTKVTATSVTCIIEAMKIMNEIQAETQGTILEALVENGQPVEYGQKLFKVKQG
jgi:acetyl-CoA carboxylase biotin carboxyl carrier protein